MGAASSTGIGDPQDAPESGSCSQTTEGLCAESEGDFKASISGNEGCRGTVGDDAGDSFGESPPNKRTTLDNLPDEVLIKILAAVSSSAEKPADVVAPSMTCRRWRTANADKEVRRRTSRGGIGIRPRHWGEGAVWFLQRLCDAGCLEACFMLGMILFYCIPGGHLDGGRLLLHSANAGHAASLHNLGIMSFNGSGFGPHAKDFRSGLALCAKAAALGHAEALREVGLCLLDGFGVQQSHVDGWRLLLKAQLAELGVKDDVLDVGLEMHSPKRSLTDFDDVGRSRKRVRVDVFGNSARLDKVEQDAAVARLLESPSVDVPSCLKVVTEAPLGAVASTVMKLVRSAKPAILSHLRPVLQELEVPLVDVPSHPALAFIEEWFKPLDVVSKEEVFVLSKEGVPRLEAAMAGKCSRDGCAQRETHPLEFWRCGACWSAKYCSRSCQLQDWRCQHAVCCKGAPLSS